MALSDVKYCKIYPGIGVARVGDSPDEFFIGPESPGMGPSPDTVFKDAQGRIKRQAARFRVYGFDANGRPVQELTALTPGVTLQWTVTLANRKASGHRFLGVTKGMAFDKNPEPRELRNKDITERSRLEITPSPRSISGSRLSGSQFAFDDGAFLDTAVYLGELRTDEAGRLLVLGGRGVSGAVAGALPITDYANNDGWYDDTSDGPVSARVTLEGVELPVDGSAWVLVAPPKFAPFIRPVVSLHEVMAEAKGVPLPQVLSFTQDLYPLFAAFADQQWVNAMALRGHGPQKPGNFRDPQVLDKLRDNSPGNAAYRQRFLERVRDPVAKSVEQANYNYMPLLSGDEGDVEVDKPDRWLSLPPRTYEMLKRWAAGDFQDDWTGGPRQPVPLEALPIEQQPEGLNRAALEFCVGGPFYPGIEITYVARNSDWYSEPFRFDATRRSPGEITQRMAVPWQADFYECQIHWWPSQRPDDVLNEQSYREALTIFSTAEQEGKLAQALSDRIRWDRGVGARWANPEPNVAPDAPPGDNDMVEKWRQGGFVVPVRTSTGEVLQIEKGRSRYDGLRDRDYFYYLLNADSYPDFAPKARELAETFLRQAQQLLDDPTPGALDDFYRYFPYSKEALTQRLDEIYAYYQADAARDPVASKDNIFKTREDMIERLRQFAPLNQLDGAWIRNVARVGPIDEVSALLFTVWMDEVGNGNPDQNHSNVYTHLLESVGIHLPPVNSHAYAQDPRILDSAYTVPMFELAISQFTDTFYPEILGMTLQLEWEVLSSWPTVKLLRHFGLDAHFYELHIGIDNASNGHGANARKAVERFLDDARRRGGEAEVQNVWRRIWTGYVAFATTGTLGNDLRTLLEQRHQRLETPADKVDALMVAKKKYGSLNHNDRKVGGQLINDLFEDPQAFREALVKAGYIVPGHPEQSSFFRYTSFSGPMYKVFTEEELQLWEEWTVWLGSQDKPKPPEKDVATLMAACIEHFRGQQEGSPTHQRTSLTGPDPRDPSREITQAVAAWFGEPTEGLMAALAHPANGLVTPGSAVQSRFLTQILGGNSAMSRAFDAVAPDTGGKSWRQIATEWIDQGCPMPRPTAPVPPAVSFDAVAAPPPRLGTRAAAPQAQRLSLTTSPSVVARHPRRRVQGMGTVH